MRAAWIVTSILGVMLIGCGGGGGSSESPVQAQTPPTPAPAPSTQTPAPPTQTPPGQTPLPPTTNTMLPEGLYAGVTSTGRTITGLVLDDGTYYVFYSATNNPSVIAGAVQGTGTALNGSFSSSNGRDINLEGLGVLSASVSASYGSKSSLNGAITYPALNQSLAFTSTYDAKYEILPSLATIAGTYAGRAGSTLGAENGVFTISGSGTVTTRGTSGCTSSGFVSPRSKGNLYNATITFGGLPCVYPNTTFTGGVYYDASTRKLYGVALRAARDAGFIVSGIKQ